jgi:hypothetical protein
MGSREARGSEISSRCEPKELVKWGLNGRLWGAMGCNGVHHAWRLAGGGRFF